MALRGLLDYWDCAEVSEWEVVEPFRNRGKCQTCNIKTRVNKMNPDKQHYGTN